jgi:hypothetical protein
MEIEDLHPCQLANIGDRISLMRWMILGLMGCFAVACSGGNMKAEKPKTVDELLKEHEMAAYEAEQKDSDYGALGDEELDVDKKASWDEKQSTIELKRAARSAATCHGSIPEEKQAEQPKGEAEVTITFENHGSVKSASIAPPFEGTDVGACALRAMKGVIVPPFQDEPEHTITWKIDLTGETEEEE